jgi:hypothetical protein
MSNDITKTRVIRLLEKETLVWVGRRVAKKLGASSNELEAKRFNRLLYAVKRHLDGLRDVRRPATNPTSRTKPNRRPGSERSETRWGL